MKMIEYPTNADTVFIMLGNDCNLNCEYCMQHVIVDKVLDRSKIDDRLFIMLENMARNKNNKLDIRFYGGEPLLYYKDIVYIIDTLTSIGVKPFYAVLTNGKLLNEEMVDFFNEHKVAVAISWDGNASSDTRHYDAIAQKKDLIFKINKLSLSGVMTAKLDIWDFFKALSGIIDEYREVNKDNPDATINMNYDTLLKFKSTNDSVGAIDLTKLRQVSDVVCKIVKKIVMKDLPPELNTTFESLLCSFFYNVATAYGTYDDETQNYMWAKCGNGISVLNVDIAGNMYQCHNAYNRKIGDLDSEVFSEYIPNLKKYDQTAKFIANECKDCSVLRVCRGGCPLISKEDRSIECSYCDIHRAFYEPFIRTIKEIIEEKNKEIR